jgi:hypothetical protein
MKLLLLALIFSVCIFAQKFEVIQITGEVNYQTDSEENWIQLKQNDMLNPSTVISTGANSSLKLKSGNLIFSLKELSAVSVTNIKPLSRDELLLALALEELLNVPKQEESTGSGSTAVYGEKIDAGEKLFIKSDNFGVKRLNGAVQLAENGMEESAVLAAMETYRKYPDVKSIASYRIFFTEILFRKGLYEEALAECLEIQKLSLTDGQTEEVSLMISEIEKKILND